MFLDEFDRFCYRKLSSRGEVGNSALFERVYQGNKTFRELGLANELEGITTTN